MKLFRAARVLAAGLALAVCVSAHAGSCRQGDGAGHASPDCLKEVTDADHCRGAVNAGVDTCEKHGKQRVPFDVLTYHYDNRRNGWNNRESLLNAANVNGTQFGLLYQVALDDQVDGQPLLVTNQRIVNHPGKYEVVYVATENNTVYAIDASTGRILNHRHIGSPVTNFPGGSGPDVGINSTPVIDLPTQTLYIIVYTTASDGSPAYAVHALDLETLADKPQAANGVPIDSSTTHMLQGGTIFPFNPGTQRQRPGLLLTHGNLYAGFGSFGDFAPTQTRGWLLGWSASTLAPLVANELTNRLSTTAQACVAANGITTPPCFLTSVWMSGYGLAADDVGNVYAVTGNGAPGSYDGVYAIQESVVQLSNDLSMINSLFTPTDTEQNDVGVNAMDDGDLDLGAGGVMLLPDQPGPYPHLAVIQGKIGPLYVLDRDQQGTYGTTGAVTPVYSTPTDTSSPSGSTGCWCGPSYFVGPDRVPRVVTSSGLSLAVWKLTTSPSVSLTEDGVPYLVPSTPAQYPGFMTSVSSDGEAAGSAVIWAVPHAQPPQTGIPNLTLFAFDAANLKQPIFTAPTGFWPNVQGAANIVPVVANGRVFVASYQTLAVFGLGGHARLTEPPGASSSVTVHVLHGVVTDVVAASDGQQIAVRTRTGKIIPVDTTLALKRDEVILPTVGAAVEVRGAYYVKRHVLLATSIRPATSAPESWEPDR